MRLYIVRHGETQWNTEGRLQGQADIPLNEKGRAIARATAMGMKEIHFDAAFTSPLIRARETAQILLDKILDDYDFTGSEVALMVNGLGGTPLMELYILNNDVQDILAQKGIKIYKTFVGNYMTAIEMAGCSLTLMKLDEELKELLDAPCSTTALTLP